MEAQRASCRRMQPWAFFFLSQPITMPRPWSSLVRPSALVSKWCHPLLSPSPFPFLPYIRPSGFGRKTSELSCLSPPLLNHIGGCDTDISASEPYPPPPLSRKLPSRGASGLWARWGAPSSPHSIPAAVFPPTKTEQSKLPNETHILL